MLPCDIHVYYYYFFFVIIYQFIIFFILIILIIFFIACTHFSSSHSWDKPKFLELIIYALGHHSVSVRHINLRSVLSLLGASSLLSSSITHQLFHLITVLQVPMSGASLLILRIPKSSSTYSLWVSFGLGAGCQPGTTTHETLQSASYLSRHTSTSEQSQSSTSCLLFMSSLFILIITVFLS